MFYERGKKELRLKATMAHLATFCSFKRRRSVWCLAQLLSAGLAQTVPSPRLQSQPWGGEAGGLGVQNYPELPKEPKASLGDLRPGLKIRQRTA